jgi:glycine/D-amino acid oxidase-like deaminating enzyme
LERADPTLNIVLLEANSQLAGGASTASMEQFRTCWVPQAIANQVKRSLEVFLNADDYLGEGAQAGLNIHRQGYLWLAMDEREAQAHCENVELMHTWGISHAAYLDGDELRRAYPWLPDHIVGAKFDPQAGWLSSDFLANRLARATQRTRFLLETPAQAILVEGGRVTGVQTPRGAIHTSAVVIANGPGARALGRTADIDLPLVCIPRQSFWTPYRQPDIPASAPLIISRRPYAHFRPEGDGLTFAWSYHWVGKEGGQRVTELVKPQWPIERLKDPRFPEATLYLLGKQFRQPDGVGFRDPRYLSRRIGHQVGYYVYREATNDESGRVHRSERAIIDRWPGIDGLFLSVGHAGHGIMTAPAAAEIVAALVLGQTPPIPLWEDFGLGVKTVPHEEGGGL